MGGITILKSHKIRVFFRYKRKCWIKNSIYLFRSSKYCLRTNWTIKKNNFLALNLYAIVWCCFFGLCYENCSSYAKPIFLFSIQSIFASINHECLYILFIYIGTFFPIYTQKRNILFSYQYECTGTNYSKPFVIRSKLGLPIDIFVVFYHHEFKFSTVKWRYRRDRDDFLKFFHTYFPYIVGNCSVF